MNSKRFTLLTLAFSLLTAGVFFLSNTDEAQYYPRPNGENPKFASAGYLSYIQSIKANRKTGKVSLSDVIKGQKQADRLKKGKASLGINWAFKGPDNIGGRTRALIIDRNNSNHLLAGAVTGGIFESFDGGQNWTIYDADYKVTNISCIAQDVNGSFYVGTGGHFEKGDDDDDDGQGDQVGGKGSYFFGSGLHKLTGGGNFETIVEPNTRQNVNIDWATIGQIATDPANANIIYAAMNNGFRKIDMSTNPATVTDPIGYNQQANDVDVSTDGRVIVSYEGGRLYTSPDNGNKFMLNDFPEAGRIEVAFAPSDQNIVYASMSKGESPSQNCLWGVFRSRDGGVRWSRISPSGTASFDMMRSPGVSCQGNWNNTIAIYPTDAGRIIVGGVTMYRWEQSSTDPAPPNGSWNQIDVLISQSPNGARINSYVHPDKHRIVFDPSNQNRAYIATDGGIFKTEDFTSSNPTYRAYNFNYRATQYYDMGVGPNGVALAGAQDNGSHLIGLQFNNNLGGLQVNSLSGLEVNSDDGIEAEMSVINPSIGIASRQNGEIFRVQGIGTSTGNSNLSAASVTDNNAFLGGVCGSPSGCSQSFYTVVKLWESFNHVQSKDSVDFQITEKLIPPMTPGRVITYTSNNSSSARVIEETYVVPPSNVEVIVPFDTLIVGDILNSEERKNLTDLNSLTVVVNYDTLTVDPAAKTLQINRPNGSNETQNFSLGVQGSYVNQYLSNQSGFNGPLPYTVDSVDNKLVIDVIEPQIDFYYQFKFQDRVQSMLLTANWPGQGSNYNERNVYITKDVLKNSPVIDWFSIAGTRSTPNPLPDSVDVISSEFSADGNHLFLGLQNGDVFRVSGINDLDLDTIPPSEFGSWYDVQVNQMAGKCVKIFEFHDRAVTDIAVDPTNANNVVVSLGNYGNGSFVARSTVAITADTLDDANFTFIQGTGANQLPEVPAYSVLLSQDTLNGNNNVVLYVGTELGVFTSENAFESTVSTSTTFIAADTLFRTTDTISNGKDSVVLGTIITPLDSLVIPNDTVVYFPADTMYIIQLSVTDTVVLAAADTITRSSANLVEWSEENVGMGRVPVFSIEQMKFSYEYAVNSGIVYAATHGRGIYETDKFVGLPDVEHNSWKEGFKSSLKFYPNPVRENAKIEFNLAESGGSVQVQIYDIKGQLMSDQNFGSLAKGPNKLNMNFDEFKNGTYILRVINNSEVVTQKFVLYR